MPETLAIVAENCEAAYNAAIEHRGLLDELYEYVLPYRTPAGQPAARKGGRMDRIFDATATKAAFRFAGRMQQDVTPAFQRFFELKLGPYSNETGDRAKSLNQQLELVAKKVSAVLEGANFATASHEMYLDLFGGTAALLMLEHERDVLKFVAVPVGEIALRENGFGEVNGIYWKKQFKARDLPGLWPSAETVFSADLAKTIREKPSELVTIGQACEFDEKAGQWHFTVWRDGKQSQEQAIYEKSEKTCPWLTPRFYKIPGEAFGRGPGLMGLPTAKTLNKVTELTIKAAAFAILGLWIYRNDRVFNPKMAKMKPGAMWQVSATGGAMGASVSRLEVPGRFDISNIVLQDLREAVKQVMLDDTLPPDSGSVRSATEIVERMKRLSADLAGAYARMVLEIIKPLVQRVLDVLYRRRLIEIELQLDQLLTKVEVVSPVAKLQQAQDVSSLVEWLQIMLSLGGMEITVLTAKVEDIFTEIGTKMGVPERLMRGLAEKQRIQQMVAQIIANAQAAAQQQQAQAAGPPRAFNPA